MQCCDTDLEETNVWLLVHLPNFFLSRLSLLLIALFMSYSQKSGLGFKIQLLSDGENKRIASLFQF